MHNRKHTKTDITAIYYTIIYFGVCQEFSRIFLIYPIYTELYERNVYFRAVRNKIFRGDNMIYAKAVLTSIGSIIVLFVLAKIIGNKQISQINMFDYINSITIGSIAAEMAISNDEDFMVPLIAMVIYALAAALITVMTNKSLKLRRFFTGCSVVLIDDNKIYMKNLKRARIDLNELLTQCRLSGYFDISEIHSAYMEANGMISVLPKEKSRAATPKDLNLHPDQTKAAVIVITDGQILERNLNHCNADRSWLLSQIKAQGAQSEADVALASLDTNGNLTVFLKNDESPDNDRFE